ncbi:MAG: hypothetical protein CL949_19590 [Erythrobacter sp.]|nr:hypothetical protein [Erythrobacter sp.]|tara:strand:- start:970 stop:1578 length:609 start_codon:yes stop_codon:yes gene_type:complete
MILLPEKPGTRVDAPRLLDFGGFLTPSGGGQMQRLNRKGNRYAVAVTMPPMREAAARIFVNRLIRGKSEGVRMAWPLDGFRPGSPNIDASTAIVVDGAGQAGMSLSVQNVTPQYAFREGQPISLEISGQHFFDFVSAPVIADASGRATVPLTLELRAPPPSGSILHVAKPMIEGFIVGSEIAWEQAVSGFRDNIQFDIQEAR